MIYKIVSQSFSSLSKRLSFREETSTPIGSSSILRSLSRYIASTDPDLMKFVEVKEIVDFLMAKKQASAEKYKSVRRSRSFTEPFVNYTPSEFRSERNSVNAKRRNSHREENQVDHRQEDELILEVKNTLMSFFRLNSPISQEIQKRVNEYMFGSMNPEKAGAFRSVGEKKSWFDDVVGYLNKAKDIFDDNEVQDQKREKTYYKIIKIFGEHLRTLKHDHNVHIDDKETFFNTDELFDILMKMELYSPSFQDLTTEFEKISQQIKEKLLEKGDYKAELWNIRTKNIWAWCRVLIERTAHPTYFYIRDNEAIDESKKSDVETKFNELWDLLTLTVVSTTMADDIADLYQHPVLAEILSTVHVMFPKDLTEESYRPDEVHEETDPLIEIYKLREKVTKIEDGIFLDGFDFTVRSWGRFMDRFKLLLGGELREDVYKSLINDYKFIKECTKFACQANISNGENCTSDALREYLQYNMMANSFSTIQTILLNSLVEQTVLTDSDLPATIIFSYSNERFRKIRDRVQECSRISNDLATWIRELAECDVTNVVFIKANAWINSLPEKDKSSKFLKPFETIVKELNHVLGDNESEDKQETKIIDPPQTLFQALSVIKQIQKERFDTILPLNSLDAFLEKDYKWSCQSAKEALYKALKKSVEEGVLEELGVAKDKIEKLEKLLSSAVETMVRLILESPTLKEYFDEWKDKIGTIERYMIGNMVSDLIDSDESLDQNLLTSSLQKYIDGWKQVHASYLLFKYEPGHV